MSIGNAGNVYLDFILIFLSKVWDKDNLGLRLKIIQF